MANVEQFPGRLEARAAEPLQRAAPQNVEAEQALLGAILINNDAFDRVSDFLKSVHFSHELHRRIFEIAGQLIRAGKLASPITVKGFLGEHDLGGITVQQYLARLVAEATTIINAQDYGRTIHDLAVRRELIRIGEDVVNVAFDAPVDMSPREQIEEAERRLYSIAETGRYDGGFATFSSALKTAIDMAAKAYERDGHLSGIATNLVDLDHIELLRGPQGTLLGKNTTVGALVVTTAPPSFDPSLSAELSVTNHNGFFFRGNITGPIIDQKLAGRLTFYDDNSDGFILNHYNNSNNKLNQ